MAANKQNAWEMHKRDCAGSAYGQDCAAQEAATMKSNMSRWGTPFSVLERNAQFSVESSDFWPVEPRVATEWLIVAESNGTFTVSTVVGGLLSAAMGTFPTRDAALAFVHARMDAGDTVEDGDQWGAYSVLERSIRFAADFPAVDLDAAEAVARETPTGVSLWPKIKGYLETAAVAGAVTVASLTAGLVALAVPVALATAVAAVALGQMGAAIAPLFGFSEESVLTRSERFGADSDAIDQAPGKPPRQRRKKAPAEVVEEVVAAVPEAYPWVATISRVLLAGIAAAPAIADALTGAGVPFVLANAIAAVATTALGMGAGLWTEGCGSERFAGAGWIEPRGSWDEMDDEMLEAAGHLGLHGEESWWGIFANDAALDAWLNKIGGGLEWYTAAKVGAVPQVKTGVRREPGYYSEHTEKFSIAQRIAHLARIPAHLVDAVLTSGAIAGWAGLAPVARAVDLTVTGGGSYLSTAPQAGQDLALEHLADAFESVYASARAALGRDPTAGEFVDLAKRPSGAFSMLMSMFRERTVLGDSLRFWGDDPPLSADHAIYSWYGHEGRPNGWWFDIYDNEHDTPWTGSDGGWNQNARGVRSTLDLSRFGQNDEAAVVAAIRAAYPGLRDIREYNDQWSEGGDALHFTESRTLADRVAFEAGDNHAVVEIVARVRSGDLTGALSRLNDLRFAAPLPANLAAPVAALHEQVKSEVLAANGVAATGV